MRIPSGLLKIVKEVARHLLRRPVVGVAAAAKVEDGRWVLIRRTDTGEWALPGGTLEWGETLHHGLERELNEEAGVRVLEFGKLLGVYSAPERDERFHAVTVVIEAKVSLPLHPPDNALEIAEVALFKPETLPKHLAHGMSEMLENAKKQLYFWE